MNIEIFCEADDPRIHIRRPFTRGSYTYATDGAIIVRVPVIDGYEMDGDKNYPKAEALPWDHDTLNDWQDLPEVDLHRLEMCCECNGDKELMKDCETCEGTGANLLESIEFGEGHVMAYYLRKMAANLSGVKISPYQTRSFGDFEKSAPPIRFKFSGGCGLLMPMSKPD